MEATRPAALSGAVSENAQLAKATLRRLALDKLEPTPENYAKAWRQESGEPPIAPSDDGPAIAALIERIVRGIERVSRGWTPARKKDSLQRVLSGSRSDAKRLLQRLSQLVASWDSETGDAETVAAAPVEGPVAAPAPAATPAAPFEAAASPAWARVVDALGGAVQRALPAHDDAPHEIAGAIDALTGRVRAEGATPALIDELEALCLRAAPILQHRHHLVDQLKALCSELTASLTDLAENDSWAKGQCEAMQVKIDEGLSGTRRPRGQRTAARHARAPGPVARRACACPRGTQGPDQPHAGRARRARLADRPVSTTASAAMPT